MGGVTNRGKFKMLEEKFRGVAAPANYYMALVDDSVAPGPDSNVLSDLGEIPAGNGYLSGGIQLAKNATDFDVINEDDTGDLSSIQIKDLVWTASGGNLPASGNGARYAVLTDDNVTVANREILAWFDLGSNRIVSDGQPLTLQDCELRLTE